MSDTNERRFDTFSDYRDVVQALLTVARQEILIFDPDLRECALASAETIERLREFTDRSPVEHCVRIVVQDATHIERDCPRLIALLASFGHRIRIRIASREHVTLDRPFIVADGCHALLRFHRDDPRGKLSLDDKGAAMAYRAQFETIWERARTGPSGAPLGI